MAIKKKMLQAAAGNAGGGGDTILKTSYDAASNQITLTEYNSVDGEVGSKTIQLQSKTVNLYRFSPVSYDGTTMAVLESLTYDSTQKTHRVYKIDLSNGLDAATASDYFDFSGTYTLGDPFLSPNATRICFSNSTNYIYVYDVSTWSSPSQVYSIAWNNYSNFSPRNMDCVSPNGTFLSTSGSSMSTSIYEDGSSYSAANQSWGSINRSASGFNYDGSYHFHYGRASNSNYLPYTRRWEYNGTSATSIGIKAYNGYLNSIHWGEADDANSYIFLNDLTGTDRNTTRYLVVWDYVDNSLVYQDTTVHFWKSLPGGKVIVIDSGTGLYDANADKIVLDINDSYADVTSDYHTDFITNYNGKNLWWKDGYHSINSSY